MPRTLAAAANPFLYKMLNQYRCYAGQFPVTLTEINLTGDDVETFLQNQSTFDISLIPDNGFQLTSFLDPQGRVECFGWLVRKHNKFSYLIPEALTELTLTRLNKFLISEDVTLSDPLRKTFWFLIGPDAAPIGDAVTGILFDEKAYLQEGAEDHPEISPEEVDLWRALTGYPRFDGKDFRSEIINNLRLFDLSLKQNKGCYPGQETVSKIATRRGAAYSPVLIELNNEATPGDIYSFEKKIGTADGHYVWKDKHYLTVSLLRDFRVEGMKIQFSINDKSYEGTVRYYPLISGEPLLKAEELFYEGSEHFRKDELELAEEKFRLAIKIDPTLADAYESLGVMLGRLERFEEALELMKKLAEVNPKSVLAHTNMSLFLMRLGRIEEAEEQKSLATVKSFQSFGDEADQKEMEAKRKQAQQDEWSKRESMFRQVLEIDPEDALANYGLGSIAVEKGDWEVARCHLEAVLKSDPKYSVAYLALGRALKGLGLVDEAKKVWQEGIKVAASKGDLMPANQMQQELNS